MVEPSDLTTLIVDPEEETVKFVRYMLDRAGYRVLRAPSGKEGLIAAWRDRPDVIVLELDLPDLDGLELIRKIRADARTRRTPIVVLTDMSQPETVHRAREAGADEYIIKQTDAIDLLLRFLADRRQPLSPTAPPPPRSTPGRMFAVLGAKGGVGTSSLCLNLASIAASDLPENSVVVVDLVLPLGGLATLLEQDATPTLATYLGPQNLPPRAEQLREMLPEVEGWGFRFVPGVNRPEDAAGLEGNRLAPFLQALRAAFKLVFVDIGVNLSRFSLLALSQAERVLLVVAPSPDVIHRAQAVLEYLERQEIPAEQIQLISNRPYGVEDLSIEAVSELTGHPIETAIPHMGENMALSNLHHFPLTRRFPEELGTEALAQFARSLTEPATAADSM